MRGPGCQAKAALQIPPCWHTGLRGCQHHSTTGCRGSHSHYELPMFRDKSVYRYLLPCLCLCVCLHLCVCVLWVLWVWDRVGEGKQRSYSGRNIIYCAVSFGERERERIPPVLLTLFFCFYLSGVGWLSTLSLFFFSAIPCFTLIQSNVFVAGSCSGYKQSYAVCHRASRFSVYFCRSCWSEWVFPHFLKASADPMHQIGIGND